MNDLPDEDVRTDAERLEDFRVDLIARILSAGRASYTVGDSFTVEIRYPQEEQP